jgi:hypothetical protein
VADAWNNGIGRFSVTIPSWVPQFGGNSFSMPRIPRFHEGTNMVPGMPGQEVLAIVKAGETIGAAGPARPATLRFVGQHRRRARRADHGAVPHREDRAGEVT